MSEYDADVQHLAEYLLGDPPYRAATPEHHARRVHGLATAVQRAIDAWLTAHPLAGPERRRWARVSDKDQEIARLRDALTTALAQVSAAKGR